MNHISVFLPKLIDQTNPIEAELHSKAQRHTLRNLKNEKQ